MNVYNHQGLSFVESAVNFFKNTQVPNQAQDPEQLLKDIEYETNTVQLNSKDASNFLGTTDEYMSAASSSNEEKMLSIKQAQSLHGLPHTYEDPMIKQKQMNWYDAWVDDLSNIQNFNNIKAFQRGSRDVNFNDAVSNIFPSENEAVDYNEMRMTDNKRVEENLLTMS